MLKYHIKAFCGMLNNLYAFPGPIPLTDASFGRGSGPVHMTSMRCIGHEEMLGQCAYSNGIGAINCHHARDAGVVCTSKTVIYV